MDGKMCHICGNEIALTAMLCVFCGSGQVEDRQLSPPKPFVHRTVNLELGRPTVEPAMQQLHAAIGEARMLGIQALTIIHGYGSSGRGGAIRQECRKVLDYMQTRGELQCVVAGEDFNRRNGLIRQLLRRYPALGANANLNRGNRGITLVIV